MADDLIGNGGGAGPGLMRSNRAENRPPEAVPNGDLTESPTPITCETAGLYRRSNRAA